MRKQAASSIVLSLCLFGSYAAYAATTVDLSKQPVSFLKDYVASPSHQRSLSLKKDEIKETKRAVDKNSTTHIRMQQMHAGYPVWGADSVVHVPASRKSMPGLMLAAVPHESRSTMNGVMYQGLDKDLNNTPAFVFSKPHAAKAVDKAKQLAVSEFKASIQQVRKSQLMVYVDSDGKARWAFFVSLRGHAQKSRGLAKPTFILDAETLQVLESWNDAKTLDPVKGGGYGGNKHTGKLMYDGLPKDLAALNVERDASGNCFMRNSDVIMLDARTDTDAKHTDKWGDVVQITEHMSTPSYACPTVDGKHNNVYWNESLESVNGGYSPTNDALYAGSVVQSLYKDWYGVPMLVNDDKSAMQLTMIAHFGENWENAAWDDEEGENNIKLGDGENMFYPLTSLGVIAHEVSHGFTIQHANLSYRGQSGGMNESFSDMAAQAAEVYAFGKNTWEIGPEIVKEDGMALRYMDQPSKDCTQEGQEPGNYCSIDKVDQYFKGINVHFSSGIYNRVFYKLATAKGWDVRKAFEVMLTANSYYWTSNTTFEKGACGVMSAAKDLKYNSAAVVAAFNAVGIDVTKSC